MFKSSSSSIKSSFVSEFNRVFFDFVEEIINTFPNDNDIKLVRNQLINIRKINPKLIIKTFYSYVIEKYSIEIEQENIDFFINKDYRNDLTDMSSSYVDKIVQVIERLRTPVKNMNKEQQQRAIEYIKTLKHIGDKYFDI